MTRRLLPILISSLFALPAAGQALYGGSLDTCVGPSPPIDVASPGSFVANAQSLVKPGCTKSCKGYGKTWAGIVKLQHKCATKFLKGQAKLEILACEKLDPGPQENCKNGFADELKNALALWKSQTQGKKAMVKPFIDSCRSGCPN